MEGYDFRWAMTDGQFRLMKGTITGEDVCNAGCFGNVYFGNYCVDVVLNDYEDSSFVNLDFYHIGVDSGYGYTKKGTPYDFEDDLCRALGAEDVAGMNIEEFRRKAEEAIVKEISSRNFGKDFMEREVLCPPADWE